MARLRWENPYADRHPRTDLQSPFSGKKLGTPKLASLKLATMKLYWLPEPGRLKHWPTGCQAGEHYSSRLALLTSFAGSQQAVSPECYSKFREPQPTMLRQKEQAAFFPGVRHETPDSLPLLRSAQVMLQVLMHSALMFPVLIKNARLADRARTEAASRILVAISDLQVQVGRVEPMRLQRLELRCRTHLRAEQASGQQQKRLARLDSGWGSLAQRLQESGESRNPERRKESLKGLALPENASAYRTRRWFGQRK